MNYFSQENTIDSALGLPPDLPHHFKSTLKAAVCPDLHPQARGASKAHVTPLGSLREGEPAGWLPTVSPTEGTAQLQDGLWGPGRLHRGWSPSPCGL